MKSIARIDQESKRTHGWYVRVRKVGIIFPKFFSDKKCGGKENSLQNAIEYRNSMERALDIPRTDKNIVYKAFSITGIVGVNFSEKENRYNVSWITKSGKQGKTSVSIRKWGKLGALERACRIRNQKEQERLNGN